ANSMYSIEKAALNNFKFTLATWLYDLLLLCEIIFNTVLNVLLGSTAWSKMI
ncbi:18355_t:CDS:1, partial [Gigaspora margarita]